MPLSKSLLILAANLALTPFVSANDQPTLEQRLEKLAQSLETARQAAHIPGMSIAIVKDDKIVWTRGFGLADVAAQTPADENTIYAIGSTTKAFTSTLVGMQVDQGNASWDDPVTEYLPYFDLQIRSDNKNDQCTLRDLLSHRHGFSRMGILIMSGNASQEEVLKTAAGAEPWDDFRKGFHYSNVAFLAAGKAAGIAGNSTWDEMMADRIFNPLNMTSTTISVSQAQSDPRLALGYKWEDDLNKVEHMKMVDLGIIGPAGAVNSNVVDMAQWLRLQLGQGQIDGTRLISTQRILDTWTSQIEMAPGRSYGLGWMLREHDGHNVIEHGGNIDGFSAQVSLIPEENLGYVLLMNLNVSPLREASIAMVFDALLDQWPEENTEDPTAQANEINFDEYTGLYIANFAKFRDEEFEITVNNDTLSLDIPSQMTFELKAPDENGKWGFVMTDQVAISFDRNDQGAVIGLKVHQKGLGFEVPRKGIEILPEVPAEQLEKYTGTYIKAKGSKRVDISIVQGRLAMNDNGTILAFNTPDANGNASLRARPDWGATFKTDAEGNCESFIFRGNAGERLFTRLADSPATDLPTLEQVLNLRKTNARINTTDGTEIRGEVWIAQAGVRGTVTIHTQGNNQYANHMDFGKFGNIIEVANNNQAWAYNPLRGIEEQIGDRLTQALLGHPNAVEGNWNDYFDSVEVIGNDTIDGRPVHIIRLKKDNLPSRTYRVDAENGDVLRTNQIVLEDWGRIPVTTTYSNFKEFDGTRRPTHIQIANPMSGKVVLTLKTYESGLNLNDKVFTLEDPEAKN